MPFLRFRRSGLTGMTAVLVALAGSLLVAPAAEAVPTTYTVSGYVSLEGGGAPGGAGVTIDDGNGDEVDSDTTDDLGDFSVEVHTAGTYTISAYLDDGYSYRGALTVSGDISNYHVTLLKDFACSTHIAGSYNAGQRLTVVNALSPSEPVANTDHGWYRYKLDADGYLDEDTLDYVAFEDSYTLTDFDQGYRIGYYAYVQGEHRSGYCATDDGPASPVVGGRLTALQGSPTIGGKAKVGKTLTAAAPLAPGTTATYQWFRVSKKKHHRTVVKPVASGPSYKIRKSDKGTQLFVRVVATGGGRASGSADSARVKVKR